MLSTGFGVEKEFDILPTVLCHKPDGLVNVIGWRAQGYSIGFGMWMFHGFECNRYSISSH